MGVERQTLTCKTCKHPYQITHRVSGIAVVMPGEWFRANHEDWEATCACEYPDGELRRIRRPTEWKLYEALGARVAAGPLAKDS